MGELLVLYLTQAKAKNLIEIYKGMPVGLCALVACFSLKEFYH